jgi:hypothetical protein
MSTDAEQSPSPKSPGERQVVRRDYHPNPPANRSEWVMWVGNVPSDSTHDEIWRFFTQSPSAVGADVTAPSSSPDPAPGDSLSDGVVSIFLIARSSCAFINFVSKSHLEFAIARFHGQPLRPGDPRCPRIVCRVRKKDDDLTAGVGGQRGMGIHMRWIKEQKGKPRESPPASRRSSSAPGHSPSIPSSFDQFTSLRSSMSMSSDEEGHSQLDSLRTDTKESSSGSYASTNSSVLAKYFPTRYFILKSLTQVCPVPCASQRTC